MVHPSVRLSVRSSDVKKILYGPRQSCSQKCHTSNLCIFVIVFGFTDIKIEKNEKKNIKKKLKICKKEVIIALIVKFLKIDNKKK